MFPKNITGNRWKNSYRDTLHIQQSILNHCDFFITNDGMLLDGGKTIPEIYNKIIISDAKPCLEILNTFFIKHYGTAEPKKLQDIIESTGPIILGSNTCYGFTVIEPITKEILLSAYIENGKLLVNAIFRDERGIKQLEITPNIKPVFFNATLTVSCGGKGGIVLGNNSFNHFMVGNDDGIRLAARATHTGRVVFFKAKLYALDFKRYININKDLLTLKGVVLS